VVELKKKTSHVGTVKDVSNVGRRDIDRLMRRLDVLRSKKSMKV